MRVFRAALAAGCVILASASVVSAKVSPEEAARLGRDLTPVGAERAGNADGTIPPWEGGLTQSPPCYRGEGSRYCDPFPDDRPLYTITKDNVAKYRDKLSAGQLAMLERYPSTYRLEVYQTRRTAAFPDFVYEATRRNALNATLEFEGESLKGAILGFPFPIPKSAQEVIWNHKLRYRGVGGARWNNQAAVTPSGAYTLVEITEDVKFPYASRTATPESIGNIIIYFLQIVRNPPRLAGQITLVHETMDQVREPRRAWQYSPGQRRIRRAPNVAYDNPSTASDGLRTNDQLDGYNGATDRYTWKLLGKKEMIIPYNSYKLHSDQYKYKDIILKGHINQALPRYELHRVWVVEGTLRPGTSHMFKRRVFYVDEDSWGIVLVDLYDNRDQLWRWQEMHTFQAYDKPFVAPPAMETAYDLQSGRYIAYSMNNESPETIERDFDESYFDPSNVMKRTFK
ncbi:Protein of unknown function [Fontimonas thermophila]|uniref:DUF1329 domain-containing protein n=1 Tax=Fontimonas thermophila TaxID=1076937 RepID=A0A1I2K4J5_9GAMM|nr:DUF1329 domain-containing protein [Fontimonas thermophila]SFF62012.1 Protein of unknown function [Fontimonas thermophila]